jgi:glycyl-tRNA synthetase beta subunit
VVVKEMKKSLRARLSDAAFFFEDDLKSSEKRVEQRRRWYSRQVGTLMKVIRLSSWPYGWQNESISNYEKRLSVPHYICS